MLTLSELAVRVFQLRSQLRKLCSQFSGAFLQGFQLKALKPNMESAAATLVLVLRHRTCHIGIFHHKRWGIWSSKSVWSSAWLQWPSITWQRFARASLQISQNVSLPLLAQHAQEEHRLHRCWLRLRLRLHQVQGALDAPVKGEAPEQYLVWSQFVISLWMNMIG